MATVSGTIGTMGLTNMCNGITGLTLALQAFNAAGTQLGSNATASYAAITGGNDINISPNATITVPSGLANAAAWTVTSVKLWDTVNSDLIASVVLTTDNVFPNGGDLIISSFSIEVNAA
jgi:hypothetical protein